MSRAISGQSRAPQSLCFMPAPTRPSPEHLRAAEGCLSQHVLMHRNLECLKPPVSMTIKVQQLHECGCLIHVHCRREVASLALGSRCLTRAVKPICHGEAYLISVYRNPNAFPQANGSFCHGPGVLSTRAKTKGRSRTVLALLVPSERVMVGGRELCRNPPPKPSLPKNPVASASRKDHCPFLSQSCPPDVAIPLVVVVGVTSLMTLLQGISSAPQKRREKTWLLALKVFGKK